MNKVLIIDDNTYDALELKRIINKYDANLHVEIAETGILGLQMINEDKPNIIFMQDFLPIINGIEISKIIRNNLKLSNVKTIITASHKEYVHNIHLIDDDIADAILQKPYDTYKVINILKKFVKESFPDQISNK